MRRTGDKLSAAVRNWRSESTNIISLLTSAEILKEGETILPTRPHFQHLQAAVSSQLSNRLLSESLLCSISRLSAFICLGSAAVTSLSCPELSSSTSRHLPMLQTGCKHCRLYISSSNFMQMPATAAAAATQFSSIT